MSRCSTCFYILQRNTPKVATARYHATAQLRNCSPSPNLKLCSVCREVKQMAVRQDCVPKLITFGRYSTFIITSRCRKNRPRELPSGHVTSSARALDIADDTCRPGGSYLVGPVGRFVPSLGRDHVPSVVTTERERASAACAYQAAALLRRQFEV